MILHRDHSFVLSDTKTIYDRHVMPLRSIRKIKFSSWKKLDSQSDSVIVHKDPFRIRVYAWSNNNLLAVWRVEEDEDQKDHAINEICNGVENYGEKKNDLIRGNFETLPWDRILGTPSLKNACRASSSYSSVSSHSHRPRPHDTWHVNCPSVAVQWFALPRSSSSLNDERRCVGRNYKADSSVLWSSGVSPTLSVTRFYRKLFVFFDINSHPE